MCLCLGACIVKYILTVVNLILTLVGLAITAIGVVLLVQLRSASELNGVELVPTIIIVIGCVVTIIFFLGCCGAIMKNVCMLISYTVIIMILACCTVAFTVLLSNSEADIKEIMSEKITDIFNQSEDTGFINLLETNLECCGTTGPESYNSSAIPPTCCPDALSNIQTVNNIGTNQGISTSITQGIGADSFSCNINNAYPDGCVSKFTQTLSRAINIAVTILICICIGEYVAGLMAIFLVCYIRRKK